MCRKLRVPDFGSSPDYGEKGESTTALFVSLLALCLYTLRFSYGYAHSDQDEFLPLILHLLDPTVLATDWFVSAQAAGFNIRTPFVWLLVAIANILPAKAALQTVYMAAWLGIACAVYALAHTLLRNRMAAMLSVVLALVMTPQWTLGGNDLVHSMLVPSMAGWALGLWGLVFRLRGRTILAACLLGMATWMQALVGLHLAFLCGLLWWRRNTLTFVGVYALAALPIILPTVLQQWAASADNFYYILAAFRAPHHYLFFSFSSGSMLRFGGLLAAGMAAFAYLRPQLASDHRRHVQILFLGIALSCILAFAATEVVPLLSIAQLQLFKTTVLAKVLLIIMLCGTLTVNAPARATIEKIAGYGQWGYAPLLLLSTILLWSAPDARESSLAEVETWARTHTPADAIFAVPPSWSGFRSNAQRSIVVNYKAFPFHPSLSNEWFDRLTNMAPIPLPAHGHPALSDSLDAAFLRLDAASMQRLATQYSFDYVVRKTSIYPPPAYLEEVFVSNAWIIYHISQ